jgi:hypothetical protein
MRLIEELSAAFAQRNPNLPQEDCDIAGFVAIKAIGNLLWLSLDQDPIHRQRLVLETKKLALSYLQNYFPINASLPNKTYVHRSPKDVQS